MATLVIQERTHIVIGHEIQGFTIRAPLPDHAGYRLRFQIEAGDPATEPYWSDWFFLSNQAMEMHLLALHKFLRTEGHLSSGTLVPTGPLQ